jgi:hypothetical protein
MTKPYDSIDPMTAQGPPPEIIGTPLNPAQQQVMDELGTTDRPAFRDDLRDHLRHEIEESLAPVVAQLSDDDEIFLSKRDLSLIHGCEARFVADKKAEFEWSVPAARGSVAHKAVELMVGHRGNPTPLDLVQEAIARLEAEDRSLGLFLRTLSEGERADLAVRANDNVAVFMECFPPLERKWRPVTESRVRAEFRHGKVVLQGKVDLSLGYARGNQAGKVLIDLKTGRPFAGHIEDLRFYGLLETLRFGVPPRLLVNYYTESGTPQSEAVTEDLMWSTAKRVVDAVAIAIELTGDAREPVKTPGGACRFCPALENCDEGQRHMRAKAEDEDLPD